MDRPTFDIASVVSGAQRGAPHCFDELIDAYADRLYGYFYRSTGSCPAAEDLVQDVFLRLIEAIKHYDHRERFEAYLFRIAGNLNRDRLRKARRSGEVLRFGEMADGTATVAFGEVIADRQSHSPESALEQAEQVDQLQAALGRLSSAERDVIALRHFSGLSFGEIAALMGTPLGTALARAHRGLARLRTLLDG